MRKILTKIILIVLVVFSCVTMMVTPSFVYAKTPYTSDVESLPDSDSMKNPYKAWSVAKAAGMSDAAAAGFLANMQSESGFDPTGIETVYDEFNNINGPKKSAAIRDMCSFTRNRVFKIYENDGWNIQGSQDKHGHAVERKFVAHDRRWILTSAYIGVDGHYAPGIGLLGYTGVNSSKLMAWAKKYNTEWYDMDSALAYIFVVDDEYAYSKASWVVNSYIPADHTPESAADDWCKNYEGIGTREIRRTRAVEWMEKFGGDPGDLKYGRKILEMAEYPYLINRGRTDIVDKSIVHQYTSAVIKFPQNTGFIFDYENEKANYSNKAAKEIMETIPDYLAGNDTGQTTKYSLYDLFGQDINWYRYMGESTQPVKLLDHIYSAFDQKKLDKLSLGDTVFYKTTRYLSCNVYKDRPVVLTTDSLNEGKIDPRVTTISNGRFTGTGYVYGCTRLNFAKKLVAFITYIMGPTVFIKLNEVLKSIFETEIWSDVMVPLVMVVASIAIIGFVLSLVGKIKKYSVGQDHAKSVLMRFFIGLFCLMILFTFTYAPMAFADTTTKLATILDETFNSVLTMTYQEDDVIGSTEGVNTIEAALWKTAIFQPWCIGQFGDRYENLYTKYSGKPEENTMKQSYYPEEDIKDIEDGDYVFSSAKYTGDIFVPVGNNKYIRNWAAYLYSCNSKYHIDQNYLTGDMALPEEITFPNMNTTAYNSEVAADTFRVIDAQYNISPQIYNDGTASSNYTDSKMVEYQYRSQSRLMVIYAIMLAVSFLPAIMSKIYYLFLLLITGVRLIFTGIVELAKEGQGLPSTFEKLITYMTKYFISVLRLYILTVLYTTLVGQSLVQSVLYGIIAVVVYLFTFEKARDFVRSKPISTRIRHIKSGIKNKA